MPINKVSKKSKDGRYHYSIVVNGKRKQLASYKGEELRDFKKRCDALDNSASVVGFDREPTLDDLFYAWKKQYLDVNCGAAERRTTPYMYMRYVQEQLGHRKIGQINRADVYNLVMRLADRGLRKSTQDKARLCISRPFNWAINVLHLSIPNPCHGLRIASRQTAARDARAKSEVRIFSTREIERFFEAAASSKYHDYFALLLFTGLRPSEALGLKWEDVSDIGLRIERRISADGLGELKTAQAYRTVPISRNLRLMLRKMFTGCSTSDWLFPSASGLPSMNAIVSAFKRILVKTAKWHNGIRVEEPLDCTLITFRHTFSTRLAQQMPIKDLQTILGHANSSTTLKYYIGVDEQLTRRASDLIDKVFDKREEEKDSTSSFVADL